MSDTILSRFFDRAEREGSRVAMRSGHATGDAGTAMTWSDWRTAALRFAAATSASDASDSRAVAILAGNGTVWPIADIGTLSSGMTSVGIYPTSAPGQIEKMLLDSGAGIVVCDDTRQLAVILEMQARLPRLRVVVSTVANQPGTIQWEDWLARGATVLSGDPERTASIEASARAIPREASAIIIYTSGSTGEPKGAVLSHGCIAASAASIQEALGLTSSDTTLSHLPYSHAAERIFGLYSRIWSGMETAIVENQAQLWEVASAFEPTLFGGLPRYYEKLSERIRAGARASDLLGGKLRLATSGGATLAREVAEHLHANGVTVLGAYGLTEHLCVAMNRPGDFSLDSSGPPMPGTEVRIAAGGEILVKRSELTFSGYHNLPDETHAAFTPDGEWLRTGDLGQIGDDGRLRVTGRSKELLALSNGKMVAPLPIEARLAAHPWIAQAVLHAEGRRFVSALIAPRRDVLESWAAEQGIVAPFEELIRNERVTAEIQKAIDEVNASLSRAEGIRRFVVIDRELSMAASELTPTHKVRRNTVLANYAAELDALYG